MENNRMQRGNMAARNHRAMNKSTLHVRLGISFLNSYDMTMLKEKYGIAGWGIALFIMKYLIERRTDSRAPLYAIFEIAHACHKNQKTILQIINDFPCSKSTATIKYFSVHICSSFSAIILQIMKSQTEV